MKRLSETKKTTLALVALALAILGSWLIDPDPADPSPAKVRNCFPVQLWDAHPADRACYWLGRPGEDGSGWLTLGTANRPVAVCRIPGLYEMRANGTFRIVCRTNGNAPVMVRPGR